VTNALVTKNRTYDSEPSYSPNGERIACSGYDGNDQEIYTINVRGGDRVQVTQNGAGHYFSPSWVVVSSRLLPAPDPKEECRSGK
jgi:Tol biopolymer transport system component